MHFHNYEGKSVPFIVLPCFALAFQFFRLGLCTAVELGSSLAVIKGVCPLKTASVTWYLGVLKPLNFLIETGDPFMGGSSYWKKETIRLLQTRPQI